jgi:hypothetical protein
MFHRIQQYPLVSAQGRTYRPRAYGHRQTDTVWDGWLVFFPLDGGPAIASDRETTQPSLQALTRWASTLGDVYLVGALDRALDLAEQPRVLSDLARAEYEALADAEELETRAEVERLAAAVDDAAADAARAEAREIDRERLATEIALAGAEESAATAEAVAHETAAKDARTRAAKARRRRVVKARQKRSK